jgi:AcrR family transcriptional regulator
MRVQTDQRIVRAMAELLRVQGYAATGIQQLAHAAEAPTGSIYHHFKGGKREVAAAALRQTGAVYIQLLPILLDQHDDLPTAIDAAFTAAAETIANTGWANMCPVGTVTGEIADSEPALRAVAAEVIASWIEQGTGYLSGRGLAGAEARALMYALVSALEGAFILARGQRSTEPLVAAGKAMAAYATKLRVDVRESAVPPGATVC